MKDRRPFIVFGVAALLLLLFFLFIQKGGRRFNWSETYRTDSSEPYGTMVIHDLLGNYFPEESIETLEESVGESISAETPIGNYIFIGEAIYLDSASLSNLIQFVQRGGNAFIATKTVPYDLMFHVYDRPCNDQYWDDYFHQTDTVASLNVFHPDLADSLGFDFKYLYYSEVEPYRWHYIDSLFFCDEAYSLVELGGYNEGYINFAKMPFGSGHFYLHTNPIAFTNIQLLDELGLAYSTQVFSHLDSGPIYWDAYSGTTEAVGRRRNQAAGFGEDDPSQGPLQYVLSQPSLRWAWYIILGLALLYFLFRAKRQQRVIPVLEANANTSLAFIATIGRLYFLQNDHRKLSLQKVRLFRNYIRERYHINFPLEEENFTPKLAARSEVAETLIQKIVLMSTNIKGSSFVSEKTMVEFHQILDRFYKTCK